MKKAIAVFLILFCFAVPSFASPWSKVFVSEDSEIKGTEGWSVRVDKIGAWIETYSVKIKWDKLTPTLGTWDISGEPKNLLSLSPTKIVITKSYGVDLGQTSMDINARRRLADITAVAKKIEDHYAISGYIQYVEGLEIPFAIMWDYEARKARLFMGDEEWEEKVLR